MNGLIGLFIFAFGFGGIVAVGAIFYGIISFIRDYPYWKIEHDERKIFKKRNWRSL